MVAPLSIWTIVLWNSVITNVDSYTASLDDDAYEDMAVFVIPGIGQLHSELLRQAGEPERAQDIQIFAQTIIAIDRADWQGYISELIDPVWVRTMVTTNLQTLVAYTEFETDTLRFEADLRPVYDAITGETGMQLTENVFASVRDLDACTDAQNQLIEDILVGRSNVVLPECRPNEAQLDMLYATFNSGRRALAADIENLPDYEFNLREQIADADDLTDLGFTSEESDLAEFDRGMHETRRIIFFIDQTLAVILIAPVMLMALIVVITVRSAKGFFLWTSLALISTSAFTLAPLVPWIYGLLIENPRARDITGTTDPGVELVFELQRLTLGALSGPILVWVSIIAFIGFGFLLLAALLRGPNTNTQQQVYYVMPGQTGSYPTPTGEISTTPPQQFGYTTPPPQSPQQGGTSAVDRHKSSLDKPGLSEERTFIPPNDDSG